MFQAYIQIFNKIIVAIPHWKACLNHHTSIHSLKPTFHKTHFSILVALLPIVFSRIPGPLAVSLDHKPQGIIPAPSNPSMAQNAPTD